MYTLLHSLFPTQPAPENPSRIVLVLPCCIGDVVLATAALKALRRGYPQAHITWAVGGWSRRAVEHHDMLDAILDTGPSANPARTPAEMLRLIRQLRAGKFDLAVSLVRSPLMSLALLLSGIPHRAGLDSAGRGFGYTVRVPVDPSAARHEAEIYLDVARALGLDTADCYVNVPVLPEDETQVRALLDAHGIMGQYIVVNPCGGSNPGMMMDSKRWPPAYFAVLMTALREKLNRHVVMLAGPGDGAIIEAVQVSLQASVPAFIGELTFGQIAALARLSAGYIGNDTGLTHLAAAAGARTIMIMGPSDPARYAPFTPDSLALWKPARLPERGVSAGTPPDWDWARDGIGADEVTERALVYLSAGRSAQDQN